MTGPLGLDSRPAERRARVVAEIAVRATAPLLSSGRGGGGVPASPSSASSAPRGHLHIVVPAYNPRCTVQEQTACVRLAHVASVAKHSLPPVPSLTSPQPPPPPSTPTTPSHDAPRLAPRPWGRGPPALARALLDACHGTNRAGPARLVGPRLRQGLPGAVGGAGLPARGERRRRRRGRRRWRRRRRRVCIINIYIYSFHFTIEDTQSSALA